MIHELIVTSVPRGLQAGRSGFTTVLRTRGIHPQLAEALERASGYRHVFPHGDPRNPQIRSHTVVTGMVSVLARIVDAGSDYSGRSNKLAHHIALDSGETAARSKSNPAAVLLALERSGGFQRQWSGDPREQPAAPTVPVVASEPGICQAWARLAGDAGWAGLLVDRALAKQPTWIIAPQGLDLLELFAEALGLVNYPQRWGVTFTTYALSAGDGLWLGTVDGSPEAQAARGQSRLAVVDLVRRAPLTSTSPTIEAARGTAPVPWKREPMRPAAAAAAVAAPLPATAPGGVAAAVPAAGVPRGGPSMPPTYVPGGPPALNGAPPPLVPGGPLGGPVAGDNMLLPAGAAGPARSRRGIGGLLAGGAILVVLLVGGVVAFNLGVFEQGKPKDTEVAKVTRGEPKDSGGGAESPSPSPAPKPVEPKPEPAPAPSGQSPAELAAEAARQKQEAAERERESQKNARQQAFRELKKKLEQAGHLPLAAGVNLEAKAEHTISLCDLGAAEVGVALPEMPGFSLEPGQPEWKLELLGPDQETWRVAFKDTALDQAHDLAKVEVQKEGERRMLSLRLLEMPADKDPVWVAGRQALTTVPLVLKLANETSLDFETFVQLCKPTRIDPLRFEHLLTEKGKKWVPKGKTPGAPLMAYPLPDTPWPCRVELVGRGPEGITAVVTAAEPQTIASQSSLKPLKLTAEWVWSGEQKQPFLKTTLSLQNRVFAPGLGGSGALEVQVTGSEVLPPWNGWRRLGELKDLMKPEPQAMSQLPVFNKAAFKAPSVNDKGEIEYPGGKFVEYADIAFQYVPRLNKQTIGALLGGSSKSVKRSMSEWQKIMRDLLKPLPGYAGFVNRMAPDPGPKPGDKDPKLGKWQQDHAKREKYVAAGPDVTKQFWDELKADPKRHHDEANELVLCCLLFELEQVLGDKQFAARLQEAVGEGTVEFTGRVWVDVDKSGTHKVLLAEFAATPDTGAAKPKAEDAKKDAKKDGEQQASPKARDPDPAPVTQTGGPAAPENP